MVNAEPVTEFTITPTGHFSLHLAAGFGFGYRTGVHQPEEALMRLAFCLDGHWEQAGVLLRQNAGGTLLGELHGTRDVEGARRQLMRILSLDHDGDAWLEVGERDPVIGRLQARFPGLRPVLFHSPYEQVCWAIISGHRSQRSMVRVWDRLAGEAGATFELGGERVAAFPRPEQLLAVRAIGGLPESSLRWLHAAAEAALEGRLDADRLRALGVEGAISALRELPGIGPFWSGAVVVRGLGLADVWPVDEPRAMAAAARLYGMSQLDRATYDRLAEPWRPFRTWALVLIRYAASRGCV